MEKMQVKLTLISFFRNSAHYLKKYLRQIKDLEKTLAKENTELYLLWGYGDCTDKTAELLKAEAKGRNIQLVDVSHGGPEFGSVIESQRFQQLAQIGNQIWPYIPEDSNYVLIVDPDLGWVPETLASLLAGVEGLRRASTTQTAPTILAPMVIGSDGLFYDSWAFRANGRNFRNSRRIHHIFQSEARYLSLDSAGSCFVMDYGLAKQLHWPEQDSMVGLCRVAKELGAEIFLDRRLTVYHP